MNLETMLQEFFERGREAVLTGDVIALHSFRIAAKRLRYTLEILEPDGAGPLLNRLREVQRRLGAMNDALVTLRLLDECPYRSPKARYLPVKLAIAAQESIALFQRAWPARFSERQQALWLAWARAGK